MPSSVAASVASSGSIRSYKSRSSKGSTRRGDDDAASVSSSRSIRSYISSSSEGSRRRGGDDAASVSSSRSIRSYISKSSKGSKQRGDDDGTTTSMTTKGTTMTQQELVPQPETDVDMAKLIVKELRRTCKSDAVDSVYEFLEAFISFTEESDGEETTKQNKQEALKIGSPEIIFIAMEKLYDDEEVQASCCCCLEFLTNDFDEGVRAVLLAGGLKVVVDALIAFPESRDVQIAGYAVLVNIFAGLNKDQPPRHVLMAALRFATKFHGLEMLMICSYEYAKDPTVTGIICALLANLSAQAETRDEFAMALEYHNGYELAGVGDERSEVSSLGDGKLVLLEEVKESEEEDASH